jgi:hypothetical protein
MVGHHASAVAGVGSFASRARANDVIDGWVRARERLKMRFDFNPSFFVF